MKLSHPQIEDVSNPVAYRHVLVLHCLTFLLICSLQSLQPTLESLTSLTIETNLNVWNAIRKLTNSLYNPITIVCEDSLKGFLICEFLSDLTIAFFWRRVVQNCSNEKRYHNSLTISKIVYCFNYAILPSPWSFAVLHILFTKICRNHKLGIRKGSAKLCCSLLMI